MNLRCRSFSWGGLPNLNHMHLAGTSTGIGEGFGCWSFWVNLKLLLHLWLLDLLLLHWLILLHRRVLWLHVLLHLGSWLGWGWQHWVVMLRATSSLHHRIVLLEVEKLPTI